MSKSYTYPEFPYRQSAAQREGRVERHPLVVIGAGPIGLSVSLDCAQRGIPVLLLDDNNTVSVGSRAVCYAKRPLEIWDRLGLADRFIAKGISWKIGKVFFGDRQVYRFDLLPEEGHKCPAFINLQQYYLEEWMVEACATQPLIDLRWKHRLISLRQGDDHALLTVETPDGIFTMEADWVIACDGANSDTRRMVGARIHRPVLPGPLPDRRHRDEGAPQPHAQRLGSEPERWFWFDPPFHRNQSVLLHKQATTSGASISSSAATPTPTQRSSPSG
jgi:3-(3-hydroxy-phenyl)propionate hydroxylase